MDRKIVRSLINDACNELYKSRRYLIDENAHEIDIAGHLAEILRVMLPEWNVDTDYNREGPLESRTSKTDLNGNKLKPDIIIHKRGPNGENLVAIEIKGYWNKEPREIDEDKLKRIKEKHHYRFLYRIELERNGFSLIPVN